MRGAFQILTAVSVLLSGISGGAAAPSYPHIPAVQVQTSGPDSLSARDSAAVRDSLPSAGTVSVPDSLASADTVSVPDSLPSAGTVSVPDSLAGMETPADSSLLSDGASVSDSIDMASSDTAAAVIYSRAELRQMHRDSVKHVRDSIRMATPRVLTTSAFPDSMSHERILVWNSDSRVNDMTLIANDSTFREWHTENPIFKRDLDAVYLGVSGSAALSTNWFKRTEFNRFKAYEPWLYATYLPSDIPMYNVKSTYTELAYWGTLFAYKDKEEANLRILHTQNITPGLNIAFRWQTYGGKGLMVNEETRNKTLALTGNYLGRRYVSNFGYIRNYIYRDENGGAANTWEVRDTVMDAKAYSVRMKNAHNAYTRNTFFIHHHYALAFRDVKDFFERRKQQKAAQAALEAFLADSVACAADSLGFVRDSLMAAAAGRREIPASGPGGGAPSGPGSGEPGDSTAAAARPKGPGLDDGSMITFGHIGEITGFSRLYTDNISSSDTAARRMYNDSFYIHPTTSNDSTRAFSVENKVFVRLQPWGRDAIVSKVDAGLGHEFISYYAYHPEMYLTGTYNDKYNNIFVYGGASGKFRRYFNWKGDIRYDLTGYNQNDFEVNAAMTFSFYPFRDKSSGVDFTGRFSTSLKRPDYYSNYYYSNHYIWENDFSKVSRMKIEGRLDVRHWQLSAFFGYGITGNYVYYDDSGYVQQHTSPINVISAGIDKNFTLWKFHLDNRALCQISSNQDVIPLPLLTAHCRWYIEFPIVSRDVMQMQIGVDAIYNTRYYTPAWNPAVGQYQTQHQEKLGGTPYLDAFVNVQWKKVCLFVKCTNVAQGWPDGDSFSAWSYIRPTRNIKIGIYWPFYF